MKHARGAFGDPSVTLQLRVKKLTARLHAPHSAGRNVGLLTMHGLGPGEGVMIMIIRIFDLALNISDVGDNGGQTHQAAFRKTIDPPVNPTPLSYCMSVNHIRSLQ